MDNPHQETQALLLTRIIKTVEKCNEAMKALNGHLAVCPRFDLNVACLEPSCLQEYGCQGVGPCADQRLMILLPLPLQDTLDTEGAQDIIVAARLFEHYNRNVAYNLERMEAEGAKEKESKDAAAAATALAGSVKKD